MAKIKLPAELEAKLIQSDKNLDELVPELDKFEQCGGDCTAFRSILLDVRNRIQAIRNNFGANSK